MLDRVGLDPAYRERKVTELSSGQKQRVSIGCALMLQPRLIVADEPTGNLDEATGEQVMRLLEDIRQEERTALLLVTHHLPFSRRLRRQYRLHQGVLEELDGPSEHGSAVLRPRGFNPRGIPPGCKQRLCGAKGPSSQIFHRLQTLRKIITLAPLVVQKGSREDLSSKTTTPSGKNAAD
jgi:energy-coupling factor transporter ATP-binding protein EcfA2